MINKVCLFDFVGFEKKKKKKKMTRPKQFSVYYCVKNSVRTCFQTFTLYIIITKMVVIKSFIETKSIMKGEEIKQQSIQKLDTFDEEN